MKFSDLPVPIFSIRIASEGTVRLSEVLPPEPSTLDVTHVAPSEAPNVFSLYTADSLITVVPTRQADAMRLNDELASGRSMLAQLSALAADDSAELAIAFFTGGVIDMGPVDIGVDEYVVRDVKTRIEPDRGQEAGQVLRERCVFTHAQRSYFFLSAGPAIEGDLDDMPKRDDGTQPVDLAALPESTPPLRGTAPVATPTVRNSFCITGDGLRFIATDTLLPNGTRINVITKITARAQVAAGTIRLASGRLTFHDWTQTGEVQVLARAQLNDLTSQKSSYLRKWDEFGDREGEIFLTQIRAIGGMEYADPIAQRDGTTSVRIIAATDAAHEALENGQLDEVDIVDALPDYLTNPTMTFAEFRLAEIHREEQEALLGATPRKAIARRQQRLRLVKYDRQTQRLVLDTEALPQRGTLVASIMGEVTQIKRRDSARRRILEGKSANPQLGLLIEDKGRITSLRSPHRVIGLTAGVKEKIFTREPTHRQQQAIDVALNTPDIALIQGPPGTGKTTVIAAIVERLNEIAAQQGKASKGQVLLTGFQHDAVDNLIARMSLNGMPVPKFGRPSGASPDELSDFERDLEQWCSEIAGDIREKYPDLADAEEEEGIRELFREYLSTPSHALATALVSRIDDLSASFLGDELSRRSAALARRLETEEILRTDQDERLLSIQRIRTKPNSFSDDGPERAEDALADLRDVLEIHHKRLLDSAADWPQDSGVPPFLDELADLKRALLTALSVPLDFPVERINDEVVSLAQSVIAKIKKRGVSTQDSKMATLARFLTELDSDPSGMVTAVSTYSYAYAATVQHSVNTEMQRRKGVSQDGGTNDLEYEYVIVDEAARVSPRDLMIAMAQGKRVILVGDHRQLPHIVNEDVARAMDVGEDGPGESEWLKRSMFEYLFSERLDALQNQDNIQRKVTLDLQFRMHPELGRFISRNFYELFAAEERFESALPPEAFDHELPGAAGRYAMWLDVPSSTGAGRRVGTSWIRPSEAEAIIAHLLPWLTSPEAGHLTFAVISFYKAQADLIDHEIRIRLQGMGIDPRRLRVGTVDSFQGMEFDVVFLSVVRTVPPQWTPRDLPAAVQARGIFGHLCLSNRLNVAMSRQKRLLIVVGDVSLTDHPLASAYIPGLVQFAALAEANERAVT